MEKQRVPIKEVAERTGMSAETIRIGLRQGVFPFGVAIQTSKTRWTYHVSPRLLDEYLGCMK